MRTQAERLGLIEQIGALPAQLQAAVGGWDDSELDRLCDEGLWTVRQVVHHIADSHLNAFIRVKLILTEDHPTLKPYDQDAWVELADTKQAPIGPSLALLSGVHARLKLVLESLTEQDWQRRGLHPERGELTVEDILASYAEHGASHIAQLQREFNELPRTRS